jgi:hypothetical protein
MSEPLSSLDAVLTEIADERARQDAKWGEQNHPLVDARIPTLDSPRESVASFYMVPTAEWAREECQQAARDSRVTWADILLEEFCEFLEAAALGDEMGARAELVQLGALAAAAIEAMDRRKA